MATASSGTTSRQRRKATGPAVTPQLSCELCRERKVKCDKLEPCANCVSSGVECLPIFRPRLPRGRHSQQKTALTGRQTQHASPDRESASSAQQKALQPSIEHLGTTDVAKTSELDGKVADQAPIINPEESGSIRPTLTSRNVSSGSLYQEAVRPRQELQTALWTPSTSNSIMHDFGDGVVPSHNSDALWSDPYEEHHNQRSVNASAIDPINSNALDTTITDVSNTSFGIFGNLCLSSSPSSTPSNPLVTIARSRLCQIYLDQVDPVVKILHRPSLQRFMQQDGPYLGYPEGHISPVALSAAVCYAAICSLSQGQCRDLFQISKVTLTSQYLQACQIALDRADVIVTSDITVTQAFVLYLVGRRSEGHDKAVWALVPLAIRLAKGMSLHTDMNRLPLAHQTETFFHGQMRKRLWLTICVMDLQASFAHGTEPLIPVKEVSSVLEGLRHLDDADFDEQTAAEVPEREDLTCATFAFVTYYAQVSGRLLNFTGHPQFEDRELSPSSSRSIRSYSSSGSSLGFPERGTPASSLMMDPGSREAISRAFDQKALELIQFCDPEASRQAWFTWHSTQTLVASMRLAALRPLTSTRASRERNSDMDTRLAFRILEKVHAMHMDSRCEGLRWCLTTPWHALAVAITSCYVSSDAKMLRERWPLVEQVWQLQKSQAAPNGESSNNDNTSTNSIAYTSLELSLEKLVRKTRDRFSRMASVGESSKSVSFAGALNTHPSKVTPSNRFSPATVQQMSLLTPPLTISNVSSTDHIATPATPISATGVFRAPSRAASSLAAPVTSSSSDLRQSQPQPANDGAGALSLSDSSHQSTMDATALQHLDFALDSLPGTDDDTFAQCHDDMLFDGIDMQDENLVMAENF